MFISTLRFFLKGWIADFYITPKFFFPFYGFEWVTPFSAQGMYMVFMLMALASLMIMLGLYYRVASLLFFFSFTYIELLDKTYYLNHYYLISLLAFLMILVPAQRYFSLDVIRRPELEVSRVPAWTINIFKLQLCLTYFFAGISKINHDWLIEALPLSIWLPANDNLFLIGPLLSYPITAYVFSWFGMIYDVLISFMLLNRKTSNIGYALVIIFHAMTAWLFDIGVFPWVMISLTLIFLSQDLHLRLIGMLRTLFKRSHATASREWKLSSFGKKIVYPLLLLFFCLQLLLPMRYLLYPGHLFWTEEGFRFSWRVMIIEKGGTAFFYVADPATNRKGEVNNREFLTPLQEKMMGTQPDMILQYAHIIDAEYKKRGIADPVVTVESYVTLNGSGSRKFIDEHVDLSKEKESFRHKTWILPFHE